MSLLCASPYRAPKVRPPIGTDLMPFFGLGRLDSYTNEQMVAIVLGTQHDNAISYPQFELPPIDDETYYYYACPVQYGAATFRGPSGLVGGWDGASWPLDDMGEDFGPVEFTFQGNQYMMYRTDWPGSRGGIFTVQFENG